jgi:cytochrome c-type biogenesis protein CcmH/NrfG
MKKAKDARRQYGSTSVGKLKCKTLLLLVLSSATLHAQQECAACHPGEVSGYAQSGMAHSLTSFPSSTPVPDADFEHDVSKTRIVVHTNGRVMTQKLIRQNISIEQQAAFVIGSGNHAFGYLTQIGDHVFQSPLSYYTARHLWGVAPGYESDPHPDFSRPVTPECLFCHSGNALPIADSLNRYQPAVFSGFAISCDRCHGDVAAHLKHPAPGSILNPAKLNEPARSSICESCHLTGETRIPNPGKSITDFRPGSVLEEFYTTYVAPKPNGNSIKVVSQVEQLALSRCARESRGNLWCGTCHNPHGKPAQPAAYFRTRCLTCHAATLAPAHAAPGRDCIACHMPKLPAYDGGHTAFTDHDISRNPNASPTLPLTQDLKAWREAPAAFRDRNLALALVTAGEQNGSPADVIRGYRLLNQAEKDFPGDPAVLTSLGSVLLQGKQPAEALRRFEKTLALKPNYAPYYVNAATALIALNRLDEAANQLKRALSLDPLLQQAVSLLSEVDQRQGRADEAAKLRARYAQAMEISFQ